MWEILYTLIKNPKILIKNLINNKRKIDKNDEKRGKRMEHGSLLNLVMDIRRKCNVVIDELSLKTNRAYDVTFKSQTKAIKQSM